MIPIKAVLKEALEVANVSDFAYSQSPSASKIDSALFWYNLQIDSYRELVPYTVSSLVTGQAGLDAIKAVEVEDVQFYLNPAAQPGSVQYLMRQKSRHQFEALRSIPNLEALPMYYYFEKSTGKILVWPLPYDQSLQFDVVYYPSAYGVTIEDVLPQGLSGTMIELLIYATAEKLSSKYGGTWSTQNSMILKRDEKKLKTSLKETPLPGPALDKINGNIHKDIPWVSYLAGDFPQ